MKALSKLTSIVLVAVLLLTSCKKESVSTASSLGVKIQATGKTFSLLKSVAATTPSFVWDTCFMMVSKIEFEAEKHESEMSHDSTETHMEATTAQRVNLFDLNAVIGNLVLQPGFYHEVSLKIKALKSDAGSSPVFYLEGSYTNSAATVTPIIVSVNEDFEFSVKQEGASLDGTNDYTGLINLSLSKLLSGIQSSELDMATLTNGKIIISSTSNATLYNKIKTGIVMCGESEFKKGKESNSGDNSNSGSNSGNGNGGGSDSGYHY